jgi:diaminopimelate decarboxylase
LIINRIHTHIGSGSDPDVWEKVSVLSLNIARMFPSVTVLNLGGGYKVGRTSTEKSTDFQVVGASVKNAFLEFSKSTGRQLQLEIEPGTFLVANCGAILSTIQDIVTTRHSSVLSESRNTTGHTFLKLDCGMTEILRPSL